MPSPQLPTIGERIRSMPGIRWIYGRSAPSTNGHSKGGKPQASSMLKPADEPKHLADIVEQMREDYQVAFCERILQANASAVQVTIAADGDDPTAVALAEELQELWDQSVSGMSDDVAYGRVAHEKVWGAEDGYQYIRKLEPLPFRESRMKLEDDGSFGGIELKTKYGTWECIPPEESWWMGLNATAKYPHGRSRFLPSPYEVWKEKRGTKKNRATAQSKWAVRGPVYRGPIVDFDEQTGQQFDVMKEMEPALEVHAKGGALFLPNKEHPTLDGKYAFEIADPELRGFDPNALNASMERLDSEMCRAFGIPEQTIIEAGAVGTYGSIAQKMLILFAVVEDIISQRVESFQRYVIEPTREINGVAAEIKATFVRITKRPDAFVFEVVKLLLGNQQFVPAIMSGGVDLAKILEQAGLPVTDDLQQVLAAAAQRMATAQGLPVPGAPPVQPPATLGGEYASTGRRQWQNNVKAIRDVLGDLIAGNTSETMALELLQSLGLTPERAKVLVADAKDGAVDDPELQLADPLSLAQVPVPRQGFKVPQASQIVHQGLLEFDRLFDALIDAMAHKATKATLDGIRQQIVALEADLRISGRVIGMLSPWQPRVNTYAEGAGMDAAKLPAITLADKKWRWPWIEDAIDFLTGKGVVTAEEFAKLAEADRTHVFSAPGIDDAGTLRNLQKKLAKSLELGEDLRTFRKSIEGEVALTRAQTETMYRTETKRGYVAGFDKAMRSPLVEEEFPAVLYTATPDQRVRDEHWELDGTVVLRSDTAAYRVIRRALESYNCRCSATPLSMDEAESRGISSYSDLPADAKAKYG